MPEVIRIPPPEIEHLAPPPPPNLTRDQFLAAIGPLLDLFGLSADAILADTFSVTDEAVEFTSVVPIEGIAPVVRDIAALADDEYAVWAWPVRVPIEPFRRSADAR